MNKQKLICKIGGSVFTNKFVADFSGVFSSLAEAECFVDKLSLLELKTKFAAFGNEFPLVFGAGVFGHNLAKKANLTNREYRDCDLVLVEQIQQNLLFLDKILQEIFADWRGVILVPRLDIQDGKVRVVSGDEILVDLAKKSGADLVLIASDVPGVYLGDELKTEFNVSQIPLLLEQMTTIEDNRIDVTGGMLGKLNCLRELADSVLVRFV